MANSIVVEKTEFNRQQDSYDNKVFEGAIRERKNVYILGLT